MLVLLRTLSEMFRYDTHGIEFRAVVEGALAVAGKQGQVSCELFIKLEKQDFARRHTHVLETGRGFREQFDVVQDSRAVV